MKTLIRDVLKEVHRTHQLTSEQIKDIDLSLITCSADELELLALHQLIDLLLKGSVQVEGLEIKRVA